MDQIGDVGVPELVGCDMEIKTVDNTAVVCSFFSQNRGNSMDDFLAVFISGVGSLFDGACKNILPDPFELSARECIAIPICHNIF